MAEHTEHLKILQEIPPWEWPEGSGEIFLEVLHDEQATESDQLIAAELAGEFSVINDELADALIDILHRSDKSEELRGTAAIALGPALEGVGLEGFDEDSDHPITEPTFITIQESLRTLYLDADHVPRDVRRRILEASVRAPQDWHRDAVRAAFSSDDEEWRLTAVFCMRFIPGFEEQILEALNSKNEEILREAVISAGEQVIDAAWPRVTALLDPSKTERSLLLAAIDAVASINPDLAPEVLNDLGGSEDDEIATAVYDALALQEAMRER
jgi:hypothetical protein